MQVYADITIMPAAMVTRLCRMGVMPAVMCICTFCHWESAPEGSGDYRMGREPYLNGFPFYPLPGGGGHIGRGDGELFVSCGRYMVRKALGLSGADFCRLGAGPWCPAAG